MTEYEAFLGSGLEVDREEFCLDCNVRLQENMPEHGLFKLYVCPECGHVDRP